MQLKQNMISLLTICAHAQVTTTTSSEDNESPRLIDGEDGSIIDTTPASGVTTKLTNVIKTYSMTPDINSDMTPMVFTHTIVAESSKKPVVIITFTCPTFEPITYKLKGKIVKLKKKIACDISTTFEIYSFETTFTGKLHADKTMAVGSGRGTLEAGELCEITGHFVGDVTCGVVDVYGTFSKIKGRVYAGKILVGQDGKISSDDVESESNILVKKGSLIKIKNNGKVVARTDIEVKLGAWIKAGAWVKGTIKGNGIVIAGGDIHVYGLIKGNVRAGGNVHVYFGGFIFGNVSAGGRVIGKKYIFGGKVTQHVKQSASLEIV